MTRSASLSDSLPHRDHDVDVVIAGAGPSGLMTALEAAGAGARVRVLEKRGEPALSRAGVLQPRVMEIFAMRGLAERVLARAREVNGAKFTTTDGIWCGLPGIDYGLLESDYPFIVMLSQLEVERILAERCLELGVEIQRNAEVTGVEQDADGVLVRYAHDGVAREARARYAVGADGARSAVRTALRIPWIGHDARTLAVNVDAEIPFPFPGTVTVVNNERGWGLSYPLSEQVTRLAVIDAATMVGVGRERVITQDEAVESVNRVFGRDFGVTSARISQFHDALFRSASVQEGRVFLVGESVRVHYPAAGVGMNFALQDAFNLGWKLGAAIGGWGAPDLPDSYATEREPEIDAHLENVQAQTGLQFAFDPEALALKSILVDTIMPIPEVQKAIAEKLSGLSAHYGTAGELVGSRIPDGPTADGRSLYSHLGADHYLVVAPAGAGSFPAGPHLASVVADVPGAAGRLVLVRPDGHIAAVGPAPDIEAALVDARLR